MNRPHVPKPNKPTTGVLKYGNQVIAQDKPFMELGRIQREMIKQGYTESLFHKHYYYGPNNTK